MDNKRRRMRPSTPGGKDRGKSTTAVSRTRFPQKVFRESTYAVGTLKTKTIREAIKEEPNVTAMERSTIRLLICWKKAVGVVVKNSDPMIKNIKAIRTKEKT